MLSKSINLVPGYIGSYLSLGYHQWYREEKLAAWATASLLKTCLGLHPNQGAGRLIDVTMSVFEHSFSSYSFIISLFF